MTGLVDFHVHTAPSLVPRHHTDHEITPVLAEAGVRTFVLKAHEGSTAERASLLGGGAIGSIVLNSPVGGANPDAVEVAARLGARVAWMPTISSSAHRAAHASPELSAHKLVSFSEVPVVKEGEVLPEWEEVFEVVATHDLILASGHLSMDETLVAFAAARRHGVRRLLVNHPLLPFLGWRSDHVDALVELDVRIEVGVLADVLGREADGTSATVHLAACYPSSLLVFGSDLGHCSYPEVVPGITDWLQATADAVGAPALERITTTNGLELLTP